MAYQQGDHVQHGQTFIAAGVVLAILYLGRGVLVPIALAIMLSFLVAPLVRRLRHAGLGRGAAVGLAVLAMSFGLMLTGMELGAQVVRMGSALPQYENNIHDKIALLNQVTLGRLDNLAQRADAVIGEMAPVSTAGPAAPRSVTVLNESAGAVPVPVELHTPRPGPLQLLQSIVDTVSSPLETAGVVLIVLIFILVEQDTLGDRFILLAGTDNLRATTAAVNDAAQRLSRYFVSQFGVNLAVGALIWVALAILGLPQAFLWGAMTALLRFVPYIGVWIAALCATLLAAAITPGWSLVVITVVIFFCAELLVSQLIEPRLYGHSTGLSALSVVVSAIFWSALWGPAGLMLSTPLTLCLVVAGHYLPALRFLEILFGDVSTLSLPERFYQRVLRGDSHEVVASAREFLKTQSLGAFCDRVLMPALFLALSDFEQRAITDDERFKVNHAIASLLTELEGHRRWRRTRMSVLEGETLAGSLRQQREKKSGRWQGPLDVPVGSVVLVIGVGGDMDELAAEVFVMALRACSIDARRIAAEELSPALAPGASADIVSLLWLVSADPIGDVRAVLGMSAQLPADFSKDKVMALCLSSPYAASEKAARPVEGIPSVFHSFQSAIESCMGATLSRNLT